MKQSGKGLKFNDDTIDLQEELLNVISREIPEEDEESKEKMAKKKEKKGRKNDGNKK